MGYMANVPLRFGERTIGPGEPVPGPETDGGRGRNYSQMLRLGEISLTRDANPEPERVRAGRK